MRPCTNTIKIAGLICRNSLVHLPISTIQHSTQLLNSTPTMITNEHNLQLCTGILHIYIYIYICVIRAHLMSGTHAATQNQKCSQLHGGMRTRLILCTLHSISTSRTATIILLRHIRMWYNHSTFIYDGGSTSISETCMSGCVPLLLAGNKA